MNIKRMISLILSVTALLCFVSCSGEPAATEPATDDTATAATEEPTTTEEETTEEVTTEEITTEAPDTTPDTVYAGLESGIVRDGTPRKYFCLCFDDTTQQDLKIIEMCKKYNYYDVTFFISTGLYGADWSSFVGVPHVRFTKKEIQSGIYDGFDLAIHTYRHMALDQQTEKTVISEVKTDQKNIYKLTGIYPVVMAWPGGDPNINRNLMKIVYENTTVGLGRGTTSTHKFDLPKELLWLQPTAEISEATLISDFQRFLDAECTEDMLFFCWGHGYELDIYNSYDKLENFIKMVAEAEGIERVTVSEFYQLFKDEIPSYIEDTAE